MDVSDGALLTIAEVSAGLIGLFLVGMIFYIQTGFSRLERSRGVVEPYFRASTRIVLIVYSVPLGVSLTLVGLPIGWSRLLFIALIVALVAANVSTVGGVGPVMKATGSRLLLINEIVGTAGVVVMVVLPFVLGGLTPDRDDLFPSILLGLGLGFISTCVLVLTLFDIAEFERSDTPVELSDGGLWAWWQRRAGGAEDNGPEIREPESSAEPEDEGAPEPSP